MPAHKHAERKSLRVIKNPIHSRQDIEVCHANISVLIASLECVCVFPFIREREGVWLCVGVCLSTSVRVPHHFSPTLFSKEWLFQKSPGYFQGACLIHAGEVF